MTRRCLRHAAHAFASTAVCGLPPIALAGGALAAGRRARLGHGLRRDALAAALALVVAAEGSVADSERVDRIVARTHARTCFIVWVCL